MFDELIQNGEKFTRENVMWITRNVEGKIVWLETGSSSAGFKHILTRHPVEQFSAFNVISEEDITQLLLNTVSTQSSVGTIGAGGTVYKIGDYYLNIVISSNGFVVDAYNVTGDVGRIVFK